MSRVIVLQMDDQFKNFHLTNQIDVISFVKLVKGVFSISGEITGLQDSNGYNIFDLQYFCNNISQLPNNYYTIIPTLDSESSVDRNWQPRTQQNHDTNISNSPHYIPDFHDFVCNQLTRMESVVMVLFDQDSSALKYAQLLVDNVSQHFPQLYAGFSVYNESDWSDETVLVVLFEEGVLKQEWELNLNASLHKDIIYALQPALQPKVITTSIPIIVTRGNQRQVIQVEPNENFHSSEGRRQQSLMRIKREVEKIRGNLTDQEYESLLDLIVAQDPAIIAAYQLFQRLQKEDQFITNLKAILPIQSQPQQPQNPSRNIPEVKELSPEEAGMMKHLEGNQVFQELMLGLEGQLEDVMRSIVKPFLRHQFLRVMRSEFSGSDLDYLFQQEGVTQAILRFQSSGDLEELLSVLRQMLQVVTYAFPPVDVPKIMYSQILSSKCVQQNTFKFKIYPSEQEKEIEIVKDRRKKSDEKNQLEQMKEELYIERFHQKQIEYFTEYHENLLKQITERDGLLEAEEKSKLFEQFSWGNQRLRNVFDKFLSEQNIFQFKQDLNDLLFTEEIKRFNEIISPFNQSFFENKMLKLKNFRFILNYYLEVDRVITLKQQKTLLYLYVTEDLSLLAAYEVYCETRDQQEFIETINLIYKLYSLGTHIDSDIDFDEIEQFDELIEQQLIIMFLYRRFYTIEQRGALEKNVRAGDNTILKFFKDFIRHKDFQQYLDQSRRFADERGDQLKKIQQILAERRFKRDEQKQEVKEQIIALHGIFMKNKVRHLQMLLEAVDKDMLLVKSAFEVFDYTKDKQDLVENLIMIYNYVYRTNEKIMLKSMTIELQLTKLDLTKMLKQIESDDPILKGAFELYYITRDEIELKDTISRMVKFQQ